MVIDDIEFAKYDDAYYVSREGDVYSTFSNKLIKRSIDHDGYHRIDIHGRHTKVHRLVWAAWVDDPAGKQINHKNDDKNDNSLYNLYVGTQKENIADCVRNGHRRGNIKSLTVFDESTNETLTFSPAKDFITYSGHTNVSGSLSKTLKTDWFKERFDVIDFGYQGKV